MDEISIILSSQPATTVFYIGTIAFMLLYVTGIVLLQKSTRVSGQQMAPASA
jgi:hypothetical protein